MQQLNTQWVQATSKALTFHKVYPNTSSANTSMTHPSQLRQKKTSIDYLVEILHKLVQPLDLKSIGKECGVLVWPRMSAEMGGNISMEVGH